ncbi:alpha/beta hydrolase [Adhaeribacter radiodurans]|uniref:Alpha/beta hydrolase n=1 Tax=Adhaeribacter radiodurans TaxID=2745197 RepID=A0A7L7L4W7_9BACT|nr:alpha/beta hydrolase-fold protein [Adhaeribacter radiodurans]QMU27847.1 alpha/beta hydrolase [Adhaeribacter radiodurans]
MRTVVTCFILLFFITIAYAQKRKTSPTDNSKPFVLGVIDEIQSRELAEKRILNIYLPEGYNKNDTLTYPVTYLLDGSADEDFIHVVGLFQFLTFEWIHRVPKSIVVGIATVDRRRDFTFSTTIEKDRKKYPTTGHSDKFISFLEKELQPFIEKKYKANSAKTIIGQSLGGLLATEILFKKPTLFNKYIIISPSLWWDNGSLLNQASSLLLDSFSQKTEVYLGVGKEGLTPTDLPRVMEVDANLLAEKIKSSKSKSVTCFFDYLPQEDHATIMHQAVFNALRILYPAPYTNQK